MPARLCKPCNRALELNDVYLGEVALNENGSEKLQYTDQPRNSNRLAQGGYLVEDTLPDLPLLRASGDGPSGCEFCRFLRRCILEHYSNKRQAKHSLGIRLEYILGPATDHRFDPGPFGLLVRLKPPDAGLLPPMLLFPLEAEGENPIPPFTSLL